MPVIRAVLASQDVRLLLGAGLVSSTGDWVLRVGLAYTVYVLTGSTLVSATMLIASFVPQILLGSLAGVFIDRWDARRTMIVANVLLAAGLIPLFAVHGASQVWLVYVVVAWEGCVQQFFSPAEQALLPSLVDDTNLVAANALNGQNRDLSRLIGSAAGGVVAAGGGIAALAAVDITSFAISAALITRIAAVRRRRIQDAAPHRSAQWSDDWLDGLRVSTRRPVLRTLLIFLLVTSVGEGIMSTLFAPFIRSVLQASESVYGFVVCAQAGGGIFGGLLAAALSHRVRAELLLAWGAVAFGAIDLVMFLYPLQWVAIWPAALCMLAVGLPGAAMLAGAITLIQRHAPDAHLGRVFGTLNTIEGLSVVAGSLAAGFLAQVVGIIPVIAAQGGGYVLAGLFALSALRRKPSDQGHRRSPARSVGDFTGSSACPEPAILDLSARPRDTTVQ